MQQETHNGTLWYITIFPTFFTNLVTVGLYISYSNVHNNDFSDNKAHIKPAIPKIITFE